MIRAGMLTVSLKGVNFGFWSRSGCSRKTPLYLAVKILLRAACEEIYQDIFVCFLTWSLLGVKNAWATLRSVSFRGLIHNFQQASLLLSYASPLGACFLAKSLP